MLTASASALVDLKNVSGREVHDFVGYRLRKLDETQLMAKLIVA